eukprot:3755584-Prymnesium_polylepis.1
MARSSVAPPPRVPSRKKLRPFSPQPAATDRSRPPQASSRIPAPSPLTAAGLPASDDCAPRP